MSHLQLFLHWSLFRVWWGRLTGSSTVYRSIPSQKSQKITWRIGGCYPHKRTSERSGVTYSWEGVSLARKNSDQKNKSGRNGWKQRSRQGTNVKSNNSNSRACSWSWCANKWTWCNSSQIAFKNDFLLAWHVNKVILVRLCCVNVLK